MFKVKKTNKTKLGLVWVLIGAIFFLGFVEQVNAQVKFLFEFGFFGTIEDGQFNFPEGVAVDGSSGNIIVADTFNDRIQVFDSSGNHLNTLDSFVNVNSLNDQLNQPHGVAVDGSTGNTIVADSNNDRILVFDSSGTNLIMFGSSGLGDGEFNNPHGVAVDGSTGNIIVVDTEFNRIQVFDSSGNFLRAFGSSGLEDGQLNQPHGVAVDGSTGNIIVADTFNDRIQVFNSSGNFLLMFDSFGTVAGQFSSPFDVAVDSSTGNIIIADTFNSRIQVFGITSTAPIAVASVDKLVVDVGDTVFLDGSNSSDPDDDPLTFNWTFTSIPSGSTATLDDPTSVSPIFTADVAGDYVVSLTVNDGTADSAPDKITITAEAQIADPILMVQACIDEINGLAPGLFNNPNNKKALINKLNAVTHKLKNGEYKGASKKLENDVLKKTDGCTLNGKPDKNDWIKDCASQDTIYPLLLDVIKLLGQLI